MIKIESRVLGPVATNCYLIINKDNNESIIVDPADSPESIYDMVVRSASKPQAILLTHGHFDHIGAALDIKAEYGIKIYAHEDEKDVLTSDANVASMMGMRLSVDADEYVRDRQTLLFGGVKYEVIHTPGHTKGGCCYYVASDKVLFSGDTMFCQSYGRTDFPTGSYSELINSITQKLLKLDDDVIVYPGHNEETKIGYERSMYDTY